MRPVTLRHVVLMLLALTAATASAAPAAGEVVGTWSGTAAEFASPHIQGRAQVTVNVMPDGRWESVWRQGARETRSTGRWHAKRDLIVFETDSREPLPPRLSLRRRGETLYGTALATLPDGRATTVSIALTHVAAQPVASGPRL